MVFSGCMPSSGIAGSYGRSIFTDIGENFSKIIDSPTCPITARLGEGEEDDNYLG